MGWATTTDAAELQTLTYDRIRAQTGLKSQHTLLAIHQAASALKSATEREKRGLVTSKPIFTSPTITYDSRTLTLRDDGSVTLTTLEDRVCCHLALPDEQDGYQYRYLNNDEWRLTESTLTIRDGKFYLHLGFRRYTDTDRSHENGTVLGIDLGIENLAVTSTGRFFSGREPNHKRRQFERRRSKLQKVGTRSAKRTLRRISHRERRYAKDLFHCISAEIVSEASERSCTHLVFEELDGIRTRRRDASAFHVWAFDEIITFVEYRAEEKGIADVTVHPSNTSQAWSRQGCGSVSTDNQLSRHRFHCKNCGYQVNAEYNAAKNIALKHIRRDHKSSRRMGVGQCALKSGTISPNVKLTDKSRDSE